DGRGREGPLGSPSQPLTGPSRHLTNSTTVAFWPLAAAEIVVEPAASAVTRPVASTDATSEADEANWKETPVICAPVESNAAAMIVAVSPTLSVVGNGARSTCATLRRPVHGKPRPQGPVTSVPLLEQAATRATTAVRRTSRVWAARTGTSSAECRLSARQRHARSQSVKDAARTRGVPWLRQAELG